jgi:AcrR family transcriptional regulator
MTKPRKSAAPSAARAVSGTTPAAALQREPRGARRKRETRERLLDAAFHLMAERGKDGVPIAEITEAADVATGSFYNHFESKDELYTALIDTVFEEFGNALDQLVKDLSDPAEVIAVCVRHTIRRAVREPVWGKLLIREGLSGRSLTRGLGQRLWRDLKAGMAAGRLKIDDPAMSYIAAGGTVIAAVSTAAQLQGAPSPHGGRAQHGITVEDLPERAAAVLLRTLGVSQAQSEKVARRPLPQV